MGVVSSFSQHATQWTISIISRKIPARGWGHPRRCRPLGGPGDSRGLFNPPIPSSLYLSCFELRVITACSWRKSDTEATCCRARTWSACHLPWPHHSNSGKLRTLFWLIHHCCDPPVAGYSVAGYSHQWLGIQQLGLVVALFHDRVDVARAQVLFTPFSKERQ